MSTKYRVTRDGQYIEFADEISADAEIATNGGDKTVITYEVATPPLANISARQIRQALVLSGITMLQVDTGLASLSEPTRSLAQIAWEYSPAFSRDDPMASEVATLLGWTADQLDTLWTLALSL